MTFPKHTQRPSAAQINEAVVPPPLPLSSEPLHVYGREQKSWLVPDRYLSLATDLETQQLWIDHAP
jgi:hypothetical protein